MFLLLTAYMLLFVCYIYVFCKSYFMLNDYEEEMRHIGKLNLEIQNDVQDNLNRISKYFEEIEKLNRKDK